MSRNSTRVKSNPVGRFSVMTCLILTGKYLGKIRQTNGVELVHARYFDLTVLRFLSERSQVLIKKNNLESGRWRSLCRFISSLARVLGSKRLGVIRKTTAL